MSALDRFHSHRNVERNVAALLLAYAFAGLVGVANQRGKPANVALVDRILAAQALRLGVPSSAVTRSRNAISRSAPSASD